MITYFINTFRAEKLKLKSSGIYLMLVCVSVFIPLVLTTLKLFQGFYPFNLGTNFWSGYFTQCYSVFTPFFYPAFLMLMVSRLCQIEHRSSGWKLIETQPVAKFYLYISKFNIAICLSFLCLVCLCCFSLLGAGIIYLTRPGFINHKDIFPLLEIISFTFRIWLSGLGIVAIQYFLSVRISNFVLPLIVGLVLIISANEFYENEMAGWFPYSAPIYSSQSPKGSTINEYLMHQEKLSIVWMSLFLFLGFLQYYYKSWKVILWRSSLRLSLILLGLFLFGLLIYVIEKPVESIRYGKTIIAGKITTTDTAKLNVVLVSLPFNDTICWSLVNKKQFHMEIDGDLPLGEYVLSVGKNPTHLIFGAKDSLFIDCSFGKMERNNFHVSGTRYAENLLYSKIMNHYENFNEELLLNGYREMSPEELSERVITNIDKYNKTINGFKTTDNIKPSKDFISMLKKLCSVDDVNILLNKYPPLYKISHPENNLEYNSQVKKIIKDLPVKDTALIAFEKYRDFITNLYKQQSGSKSVRPDTVFFNFLTRQAIPVSEKDAILRDNCNKVIDNITDSSKRNELALRYIRFVNSNKIREQLFKKNNVTNSLQKGHFAPLFECVNSNGDNFNLTDFRGKYLAIDIWASWCGPCREESPYFEEMAEKFNDEHIVFIGISIDEEKSNWEKTLSKTPTIVNQFYMKNINVFASAYALESIPRFILIDPEGKFISSKMPYPSEQEFQDIIQREVLFK